MLMKISKSTLTTHLYLTRSCLISPPVLQCILPVFSAVFSFCVLSIKPFHYHLCLRLQILWFKLSTYKMSRCHNTPCTLLACYSTKIWSFKCMLNSWNWKKKIGNYPHDLTCHATVNHHMKTVDVCHYTTAKIPEILVEPACINTILRHYAHFWIFWQESFGAHKKRPAARGSWLEAWAHRLAK